MTTDGTNRTDVFSPDRPTASPTCLRPSRWRAPAPAGHADRRRRAGPGDVGRQREHLRVELHPGLAPAAVVANQLPAPIPTPGVPPGHGRAGVPRAVPRDAVRPVATPYLARRMRVSSSSSVFGQSPLQQPRQRAIGQQLAASGSARSSSPRCRRRRFAAPASRTPARLLVAPVHRHLVAKRRHLLGKLVAVAARAARSTRAASPRGVVQPRDLVVGHLLRQAHRRQLRAPEISSEYALPMPLKSCGSVSERFTV